MIFYRAGLRLNSRLGAGATYPAPASLEFLTEKSLQGRGI